MLTIFFKNGILYVDNVILETNKSLVDVTVNFYQAPSKDAIMTGTFQTYVTVTGATLYVTVSIPASSHDREYSKIFMKTVVDLTKLLSGIYANPILKSAVENLLSAIDFELKFPFPVVSTKMRYLLEIFIIFQKHFPGHLHDPKFYAY